MKQTIMNFAKSKEVSYEVARHRIQKAGLKPVDYYYSPFGGRVKVFNLEEMEVAFNAPIQERKRRKAEPVTNTITPFLSVPLTPTHRWYGFNA
jgi:hypothetical protein